MRPWLLVSGDFTPLGGMDAANHALARYLADSRDVHVVAHRAWPDLREQPRVTVHQVRRPFGSHALGGALLARAGRRVSKQLRARQPHIVLNGGNCLVPNAVNWVHYVHAAYEPAHASSPANRAKASVTRRRDLAAERTALTSARLVICNSRRTRCDVIERLGVDPSRVAVVYYGVDPERFSLVTDGERAAAKHALGAPPDRPLVGFVGALGDRRKAFDTVFAAWLQLCANPRWTADLLVIGTGAELGAWRRRAKDAGAGDRMHFAGFRGDVPQMLAALDLLVHPARYEAYGLAPHEAICRGVPALVTASSGLAERIPAELAELLIRDADDAGALAERVRGCVSDRARLQAAVVPLSQTLRSRTWNDMARDIATAVEQPA